jgi:Putative collagen-binding domain of a collagenase
MAPTASRPAPATARGPANPAPAAGSIADEGATNRGPALPWQQALQLPASSQMQYLRALIESRPMLERIPDQWLLVTDPMGTTNRIQACRASDGSYAFIYTATGSKMKIRMVDRMYEKLSGTTIRAYWFDPRLGTSTLIGEFPKAASRDFTPPSTGIGNDWVLVLDDAAKKFPAPGAHAP